MGTRQSGHALLQLQLAFQNVDKTPTPLPPLRPNLLQQMLQQEAAAASEVWVQVRLCSQATQEGWFARYSGSLVYLTIWYGGVQASLLVYGTTCVVKMHIT